MCRVSHGLVSLNCRGPQISYRGGPWGNFDYNSNYSAHVHKVGHYWVGRTLARTKQCAVQQRDEPLCLCSVLVGNRGGTETVHYWTWHYKGRPKINRKIVRMLEHRVWHFCDMKMNVICFLMRINITPDTTFLFIYWVRRHVSTYGQRLAIQIGKCHVRIGVPYDWNIKTLLLSHESYR